MYMNEPVSFILTNFHYFIMFVDSIENESILCLFLSHAFHFIQSIEVCLLINELRCNGCHNDVMFPCDIFLSSLIVECHNCIARFIQFK